MRDLVSAAFCSGKAFRFSAFEFATGRSYQSCRALQNLILIAFILKHGDFNGFFIIINFKFNPKISSIYPYQMH